MRHADNIFESEKDCKEGIRSISGTTITFVVLAMISLVAGGYILLNFDNITTQIALWVANFLSSGFVIVMVIAAILYVIMRIRWRMFRGYRRFWRW